MNEEKNVELTQANLNEVTGGRGLYEKENRALNDFINKAKQEKAAGTLSDDDYNQVVRIVQEYQGTIARLPSESFIYPIDQFLIDNGYPKYL